MIYNLIHTQIIFTIKYLKFYNHIPITCLFIHMIVVLFFSRFMIPVNLNSLLVVYLYNVFNMFYLLT